jgi:oligogalacturonide lyase
MPRIFSCGISSACYSGFFFVLLVSDMAAGGLGDRSRSERSTFLDDATGATVTRLTSSQAKDDKIYQTHPNWIADGSHLVFHSDRSGRDEVFAVEESSGEIIQLTDGDAGAIVVSRHDNALYLARAAALFVVNLDSLLADSKRRALKDTSAYRRRIASLPDNCRLSGTFTEDANGSALYFGLVDSSMAYSIQKLDLATGEFTTVVRPDFQVGHCQAHPTMSGVISYCHETGGDAPQRMWITNGDGSGNRPFYAETYDEWVTHEVWWTADRMLFTIWPKNAQMRLRPYGIASISLTDFRHQLHDRFPYWHVCGTPDGQFAIGDTFEGKLFVIEISSGKRRLLTDNHRPRGATNHPHPSISPDGKRVLFVSSRFGSWDLMTVELPRAFRGSGQPTPQWPDRSPR